MKTTEQIRKEIKERKQFMIEHWSIKTIKFRLSQITDISPLITWNEEHDVDGSVRITDVQMRDNETMTYLKFEKEMIIELLKEIEKGVICLKKNK